MVTDGADTSDAVARRAAGQPEGAVDSGVHRRRRPGALRARHPGHARRNAAHRCSRARRSSSTSCVTQTGYGGATVPLHVEDDGRIVSSQDVTLPRRRRVGDGARQLHRRRRRRARCSGSGSRRRPASRSRRTTRATRWSRCATAARRCLYFEGEPRFEMKFIRRAVEDDENLQVVDPAAHRRRQVPAARRRQPRRAGRRLPEDARGAVRAIARSSSAASKRRRSRPSSCACWPTSSASAAAAC